jgi:hypothetical protein
MEGVAGPTAAVVGSTEVVASGAAVRSEEEAGSAVAIAADSVAGDLTVGMAVRIEALEDSVLGVTVDPRAALAAGAPITAEVLAGPVPSDRVVLAGIRAGLEVAPGVRRALATRSPTETGTRLAALVAGPWAQAAVHSLALAILSQTGSGIRSDRPRERRAGVFVLSDRPGHSLEIAGLAAMAGTVTAMAEATGAGDAVGAEEDGDGVGDLPGASAGAGDRLGLGDGAGDGLGPFLGAGQRILTPTRIGVPMLMDTQRAAITTMGLRMPPPMTTQMVPITVRTRPTRATTGTRRTW